MQIFEAKTFGDFLKKYLKTLPNGGRGVMRGISTSTGIHSTSLSQAIKGSRSFSLEQAVTICKYLGLTELETKCAVLLLQIERAGTNELKNIFRKDLQTLKQQSSELVNVVKAEKVLSEEDRAIFYSNWFYSGLAVLSSIPGLQNLNSLSDRAGLSKQKTSQAIAFLVRTGICSNNNGKIEPGTNSTHLEAHSPLVSRHHSNWRVKAMEKHVDFDGDSELAYSSPMSLSKKDALRIRSLLVDLIKDVAAIRDPSPSDEAYFLNVDWLKF